PVDVVAGPWRQVFERAGLAGRALPARHRLEDRGHLLEQGEILGEFVEDDVAYTVTGDDLDLREGVQDVELGERECGQAVDTRRVACDDGVEPPAAARPPRRRPELAPQLAEAVAEFSIDLAR